jgi:hypothetical protein
MTAFILVISPERRAVKEKKIWKAKPFTRAIILQNPTMHDSIVGKKLLKYPAS